MNKYVKNFILSASNTVMMLLFPIITFPYLSRILGPSSLGCIYFAQSYGYYFINIANFGITSYAVREVSRVRNDRAKVEKVSNEIFNLNFFFSIISTALYFAGVFIVPNFRENAIIFAIYSVVIFTDFLSLDWLLQAYDDYFFSAIRNMAIRVIALITIFLVIKSPDDYIIYTVILCFTEIGIRFPTFFYARRKYAVLNVGSRFLNFKEHIKSMFTLFSFRIVRGISTNLDKMMIGFMMLYENVGVYSAGVKIVLLIQPLVETVGVVLFPKINISANSSQEEYHKNLKINYDLILMMGMPMAVGIFLVSQGLIPLFAGENYTDAIAVSRIMAAMVVLGPIGDMLGSKIILVFKKDKWLLYCSILTAVSNLILNIIFIPLWGINGAAVASVASCAVSVVSRYIVTLKLTKVNLFTKSLLKYTCFVIPFVLLYCLFREQIDNNTIWMFGFVAVCVLIYVAELLVFKDPMAKMMIEKTFKKGKG